MDQQGPDFSDSRDSIIILSDSRDPIIILPDSTDPVFNSRDLNQVPRTVTPYKNPGCTKILIDIIKIHPYASCDMLQWK